MKKKELEVNGATRLENIHSLVGGLIAVEEPIHDICGFTGTDHVLTTNTATCSTIKTSA